MKHKTFHTCLLRALAIDRAMLVFPTPENIENQQKICSTVAYNCLTNTQGININEGKVLPLHFFQRTFPASLPMVINSTEHTLKRKESRIDFLM